MSHLMWQVVVHKISWTFQCLTFQTIVVQMCNRASLVREGILSGFVNSNSSSGSGLDAFGATPFQPGISGVVLSNTRTFRQMHEEFGEYIRKKIIASKGTDVPLVDISGVSTA